MRPSAFRRLSEQREGAWRHCKAVDCRACDTQLTAVVRSEDDDVIGRYFVGRGWRLGRSPKDHLCPACAVHPRHLKLDQETTMSADPPRAPTREERRKINDALDEHYLPERACYSKSFSDKALSDKLSLPRAWVAEERDRLFGPDVNEATAAHSATLLALEQRAQGAEDTAMRTAAEAEAIKREVASLRAKVGKAA